MQIKNISVTTLQVPLNRTFKTAIRTTDFIEDLFITIETNDICGYGTAPATTAITGDTILGMQTFMQETATPFLIGKNALDREYIYQDLFNTTPRNTGVKMAIDLALFDIAAKSKNLPLYQYLGGTLKTLTTDVTISSGNISDVETQINNAITKGFKILKIKLGNYVIHDLDICSMLSKVLTNEYAIRIDANQGWSVEDALFFMDKLKSIKLNIEFIEQPIAANNIEGMRLITKNSSWPIVADESVFNADDANNILEKDAANIINIKLAKSGGITNAIKIKDIADKFHKECMIGCMMESPIGIAAAAHFALAMGINKIDLDPLDWVAKEYYADWIHFENDKIVLSEEPGIGYKNALIL